MFVGNMVTEAIPARVFALYRIVTSKNGVARAEAMSMMEPEGIREEKTSSYFAPVLKAATELKLVQLDDNNIINPLVPKEQIKDIEDFRLYAISKMNMFSEEQFFKCVNAVVNMNEQIFKYSSISDNAMLNALSSSSGQQINAPMARGMRFWLQFLGFGYMQDFVFLPNAYVFVKNVMKLMNLEKGHEYTMDDFMNQFNQYGSILSSNMKPFRNINLAFSSALRELHDNKEIELIYGSDAESRWILSPSSVSFNRQINSIKYKGVKS